MSNSADCALSSAGTGVTLNEAPETISAAKARALADRQRCAARLRSYYPLDAVSARCATMRTQPTEPGCSRPNNKGPVAQSRGMEFSQV